MDGTIRIIETLEPESADGRHIIALDGIRYFVKDDDSTYTLKFTNASISPDYSQYKDWQIVQFGKDISGFGHLRGFVKPPLTPDSFSVIFELPEEYHPNFPVHLNAACNGTNGTHSTHIQVVPSGEVLWANDHPFADGSCENWISFEGLEFFTNY